MTKHIWMERLWPYVLGFGGALCSWLFFDTYHSRIQLEKFLQPALTVSATALGFIGTSMAIVWSQMGESKYLQWVKNADRKKDLARYFVEGIYLGFGVLIASSLGVVLESRIHQYPLYWSAWTFLSFAAAGASIRIVRLLANTMTH